MKFIDISRNLTSTIAVWPGDIPFKRAIGEALSQGGSANVSSIELSLHTATHVDAPYHFSDDGKTMDQMDLTIYWGDAQVVTVDKRDGPLFPSDFAAYDLGRAKRLLVHSAASDFDPTLFPTQFVYPSPELARFLGQQGIVLYGTDTPSVDAYDDERLLSHNALYHSQVAILEGLDLRNVPDGLYELVAMPLKIIGGDGSPVRAVLKRY